MIKKKRCVICDKTYVGFGNNALPLKEGLCCDTCNLKVIKARVKNIINQNFGKANDGTLEVNDLDKEQIRQELEDSKTICKTQDCTKEAIPGDLFCPGCEKGWGDAYAQAAEERAEINEYQENDEWQHRN